MTYPNTPEPPDCLLCAVRALTEGTPTIWNNPETLAPGDRVSGVVLRAGQQNSEWHPVMVPSVDLWLGGHERVRVIGHQGSLAQALQGVEPAVGDRLTVIYVGREIVAKGPHEGRPYSRFRAEIVRGHH
jgi:hypothetical protein